MGNVSRVVPSIHPFLNVRDASDPLHTVEFAEAAGTAAGDECAVTGATALAWTIIDIASNAQTRAALLHRRSARPTGATMVDHPGDRDATPAR